MAKKQKNYKLVEVEWEDSATTIGWQSIKRGLKYTSSLCRTAGYLLQKNKSGVKIALSLGMDDGQGSMSEMMIIPKSAIRKITLLKRE